MVKRSLVSLARRLPFIDVMFEHRHCHGQFPNLFRPRTFNEKVQWRKFNERDDRMRSRVDKVAAKAVVANEIGDQWVIPTLWCGTDPSEIPFDRLPFPYVIKTNQGSSTNYFVRNERDLDIFNIRSLLSKWLTLDHASRFHEWAYYGITPTIIIEPMIGGSAIPWDYKFFIFNGKVRFVQVDVDRNTDHRRAFYDRSWKRQPFMMGYALPDFEVPRPPHLEEMAEAAEKLALDFSFVRIDFYDVDIGPRFGEFTFYPDAGRLPFIPQQYDRILGDLWQIDR